MAKARARATALLAGLVLLAVIVAHGTSTAQSNDVQSVTLKFATNLPATHYLSVQGDKIFMDEVKSLSGGKIKIQYFPNDELGNAADMVTMASSGIADVVAASPPYVSSLMPLSNAFDLPAILPNADVGTKAYNEVANDPNSVIAKHDYQGNHLHFLYAATLPLYQIVTVKAPINRLTDLKGLRLRSGGGAEDLVVRAMGAVPVTMPRNEDYEAFQRGALDGGIFNLPSLHVNKVDEVCHYATTNANVSSFVYAVEISDRMWDSLNPATKKVISQAARAAAQSLASNMDSDNQKAITFLKKEGMTFTTLPESDKAQLTKMLQPVWSRWQGDMKSRGLDGVTAVKEVQAAVKSL
jgi:TRAP-type C4-dicarboxylate transport system substrate-binding protein